MVICTYRFGQTISRPHDGKPGILVDGNGLMLCIQKSGAKSWVQRLVIHNKRRDIGLGAGRTDGATVARRKVSHRRGDVLFIDARELGSMVDRTHRELTDDDIARIADTYHRWRGEADGYEDQPGFCRSAPLEQIRSHDDVLTPGRYVGAPPADDDGEPFAEKMTRLVAELREQQGEGARLDAAIARNLEALGFPLTSGPTG